MEVVSFLNGKLTLKGELYKPQGSGPFPAILYNHGSAPGMLNSQASKAIGPLFVQKGWIFFMPYRRGQGLSSPAGPYVMDEIHKSRKKGGLKSAGQMMVRLLNGEHLSDQMAALAWLEKQDFVISKRIATAGNSFGGIQTVLGVKQRRYCAGINASGAAQSWAKVPELQTLMIGAVRDAKAPIFFFQAENDFDLSPSQILSSEMKKAGKKSFFKIYPKFGNTSKNGHSFPYRGAKIWFEDAFGFLEQHCKK